MAKSALDLIALVLVIIGGLNLGIKGFGYDVIESLLKTGLITNIIYWLIGLAALYSIYMAVKK
ncbi:DUF378 domain-containing protein [Candidatus Pacearchaeota archaeon]|nr:DUF378 domain-containing protein [Candidatus Pacearchaeota archaeon]